MPEPDGTIAGACHKAGKALFLGEGLSFFCLVEADAETCRDTLNVVDGAIMREEGAGDLDLFCVLDVPQEHHLVAVHCNQAVSLGVCHDRHGVCELAGLILRNFYLSYP